MHLFYSRKENEKWKVPVDDGGISSYDASKEILKNNIEKGWQIYNFFKILAKYSLSLQKSEKFPSAKGEISPECSPHIELKKIYIYWKSIYS